uniref:Uncharacterized protein n=1 Tax=Xiphophorus couchianus TaxID=32473 RepID=A0A3B5LUR2_9TELE
MTANTAWCMTLDFQNPPIKCLAKPFISLDDIPILPPKCPAFTCFGDTYLSASNLVILPPFLTKPLFVCIFEPDRLPKLLVYFPLRSISCSSQPNPGNYCNQQSDMLACSYYGLQILWENIFIYKKLRSPLRDLLSIWTGMLARFVEKMDRAQSWADLKKTLMFTNTILRSWS